MRSACGGHPGAGAIETRVRAGARERIALPCGVATRDEWRALRDKLAVEDPELAAAVDDVDQTLIESWLRLSPWERAERCFDAAAGIEELRAWRPRG